MVHLLLKIKRQLNIFVHNCEESTATDNDGYTKKELGYKQMYMCFNNIRNCCKVKNLLPGGNLYAKIVYCN